MADVSLKKLKEYMMNNIDAEDFIEVDKVNRYVDLTSQFRKLRREANKHGPLTEVVNASQSFIKVNPAIEKMTSVNSQLNALYRTINFVLPAVKAEKEEVETPDNHMDDAELV